MKAGTETESSLEGERKVGGKCGERGGREGRGGGEGRREKKVW